MNKINLIQGKFPENESEIVLSNKINIGKNVGDTIELTIKGITKKYTIVGIAEKLENEDDLNIFNRINGALVYYDKDNIEKNENVDISIITINIKDIYNTVDNLVKELKLYDSEEEIEENITYNDTLLNYSLISKPNELKQDTNTIKDKAEINSEEFSGDLIKIISIVIFVIVIVSVILIYTTFSITYNERIKEIGILSSIGMTKKQIKNMFIKENAILSTIGIVIGELLGTGIIYFIIKILNIFLSKQLKSITGSKLLIDPNVEMYMVITIGIILVTALIIYVIVYLSAMLPIRKVNNISPISAINNNINNIGIQKTRKGKIIENLLKTEGIIALRNIKRSKYKYRAITASISITIILFLVISEITSIVGGYIQDISDYKDYKIMLTEHSNANCEEIINTLKNSEILEDYIKISYTILNSNIEENYVSSLINSSQIRLVTLEGKEYEKLLNDLGIVELEKGKCILSDTIEVRNTGSVRSTTLEIGDTITVENLTKTEKDIEYSLEEQEIIKETQELLGTNAKEETQEEENTLKNENSTYELEIVGIAKKDFGNITELNSSIYSPIVLIISEETLLDLSSQLPFISDYIYIDTSNPYEIENILKYIDIEFTATNLYQEIETYINRALIINVLAYSFIIVIIMISGINIFNIIYSGFILRTNEFANLKSIGMSNKQIRKMINLEGLFYGVKAIILGGLIGILLLYGIYIISKESILEIFKIPVMRLAITVIVIYFIIFIAIYKGKKKVNMNNIVETIKNQNI